MAIGPTGPTPPRPAPSPTSKRGETGPKVRSQSVSESDIGESQAELQRKNADLQSQIKNVEQGGEAELDHLRDDYERQSIDENSREEAALEKQRAKGYEELRRLQKSQSSEQARLRREGEAQASKLKDYYRNTIYSTESQGKEDLRSMESRQHQLYESESRTANDALETATRQYAQRYQQLKDSSDAKLRQLQESSLRQQQRATEDATAAGQEAGQGLQARYAKIMAQHQQEIDALDDESARKLKDIRRETADKLAAYRDRQDDPFYKLRDMRARFREESDRYVLTARVPEFEQKNLSISVKGDQLVVAGYRRNEEKVDLGPGHVQGTNSYQSYMESYPLLWPVDTAGMVRENHGDTIRVILPKKTGVSPYQPHQRKPKRAQLERPHFPDNIPYTNDESAASANEAEPHLSGKTKGSGTLS